MPASSSWSAPWSISIRLGSSMRRNVMRLVYRLPSGAIMSTRHVPPTRISISLVSTLNPAGPNHWGRCRGSDQAANTNSRLALITRDNTISRSSAQVDRTELLPSSFTDTRLLLFLQFLDVKFQPIEASFPDLPLRRQPCLDGFERRRVQCA